MPGLTCRSNRTRGSAGLIPGVQLCRHGSTVPRRTNGRLKTLMTGRRSMPSQYQATETFTRFMEEVEPRVRLALVSSFGPRLGSDATLDAFEYAWEHWDRVQASANPAGYVYKTGAHCAARARRLEQRTVRLDVPQPNNEPWFEPRLDDALDRLTRPQRTAVVLIYGFGWTFRDVSELLSIRRSTVQRHVSRAMKKLRTDLGVRNAAA